MKCPTDEQHLRIISAKYGRSRDATVCPTGGRTDVDDSCYANEYNTFFDVHAQCDGQISCNVAAFPTAFGSDPCPGVSKYLEIEYECGAYARSVSRRRIPTIYVSHLRSFCFLGA